MEVSVAVTANGVAYRQDDEYGEVVPAPRCSVAVDLVVLAREAAGAAPNVEIASSLEKHWARIATGAGRNNRE